MRGILLAAMLAAVAAADARAAAFLDEAAWHNAVLDLDAALRPQGRTVRYVPFTVRPIEYEDGYGTFAPDSREPVFLTYSWDNPYTGEWGRRGGGSFRMTGGALYGVLGCHSTYYPCFGATRVTLGFDGEVLGFGGSLEWYGVYQEDPRSLNLPGYLPFFAATHDSIGPLLRPGQGFIGYGYDGFFGTVQPLTEFDLTYQYGMNPDNYVSVTFSGLMLVAVPVREPPSLPLVASALACLLLAGAGRALSAPGRQSAGWR